MANSPDTKPKPEIEIREEGSTMERFADLTRRLLNVTREDVRKAEDEWKKDRRKREREHERRYKGDR
jgi:hypothetical protein